MSTPAGLAPESSGVERSSRPPIAVFEPQPQPAAAPVEAPRTNVAKAERLANVERLRVLAMLEIVRYHDHDDRLAWVGGLGLPTFLLLTNLFNATLTEKRGVNKFLADKRERLFQPWIFWSLVYAAMLLVSAYRHGEDLASVLSFEMILAGTNSHLWFVPFAMFSAGLVAGAQVLTRRLPDRATAFTAAAVGVLVLLAMGLAPDADRPAPIPQWMIAIPSSFFGFALGRLVLAGNGRPAARDLLPIAAFAAIGAIVYGAWTPWTPNLLIWRYCVSLLLVFVVFLVPGKTDRSSKFFSPLLFGIYLAHHLVSHRLLVKVPFLEHSQLMFVVDFAITALLVRGLQQTPLKRFI